MAHKLILMKNGKRNDISQLIGNITRTSNIDTLGEELSFDCVYNDSRFFSNLDVIDIGDQVVLTNDDKIINYFVVVTSSVNGRTNKTFTCFDRAWYLNKNETIIQFKKASASQAIEKLLDKFSVKHRIDKMTPLITKIYKDMVVSDIIRDILDQVQQETGKKYRLEMDKDVVVVANQANLLIKPTDRLSSNTNSFPIASTVNNPSRELSIQDMKNKVIVAADGDDNTKIYAEKSDTNSISKYGLLTEVVTVDSKNAAQARNIAANTLKDLNKISETISCDMLGNDDVRAGRLIDINEPITGIVGRYLIKSATHTINNGIHRVSVELEVMA